MINSIAWIWLTAPRKGVNMARNLAQGIIGLILAAVATWLTNKLVEQLFGSESDSSQTA